MKLTMLLLQAIVAPSAIRGQANLRTTTTTGACDNCEWWDCDYHCSYTTTTASGGRGDPVQKQTGPMVKPQPATKPPATTTTPPTTTALTTPPAPAPQTSLAAYYDSYYYYDSYFDFYSWFLGPYCHAYYDWTSYTPYGYHFACGRPLIGPDDTMVRAPVVWETTSDWCGSREFQDDAVLSWAPFLGDNLRALGAAANLSLHSPHPASTPSTTLLPPQLLSESRWIEQGVDEHASVASFNQFSLSLMAHAAPASLVRRAQLAALDETKHAELSFSLAAAIRASEAEDFASAYSINGCHDGERLSTQERRLADDSAFVNGTLWVPVVQQLPVPQTLSVDASTVDLLRATFRDGCIAELLAAVRAATDLVLLNEWFQDTSSSSGSPLLAAQAALVRDVLEAISDEEAGHAVLAWRTMDWLLSLDDDDDNDNADCSECSSHKDVLRQQLETYLGNVAQRYAAGGGGFRDQEQAVEVVVAALVVPKFYAMVADGEAVAMPAQIQEWAQEIVNVQGGLEVEQAIQSVWVSVKERF